MDRRDFAAQFGGDTGPGVYDAEAHTFTFGDDGEPIEVRARYDVCSTCDGKGAHVNPSVDAHGISAEEWEQDWDEESREGYFRGDYDVQCYECHGQRVVPVPDLSFVDSATMARVQVMLDNHRAYLREAAAERAYLQRMGGY